MYKLKELKIESKGAICLLTCLTTGQQRYFKNNEMLNTFIKMLVTPFQKPNKEDFKWANKCLKKLKI